jgi:hypothetical protein
MALEIDNFKSDKERSLCGWFSMIFGELLRAFKYRFYHQAGRQIIVATRFFSPLFLSVLIPMLIFPKKGLS